MPKAMPACILCLSLLAPFSLVSRPFMHLSVVCPTDPTWGIDGANMGGMSSRPCPMGGGRWGICLHCTLNRILNSQSLHAVREALRVNFRTVMGCKWGKDPTILPHLWGKVQNLWDKSPSLPHLPPGGGGGAYY